ncbi:threonine--tRNA ligase [Candidatus Saccharibacteria bacterium]|nr:threonine--tRNA ligase [Candidatus Saccharibacteria bacterium]
MNDEQLQKIRHSLSHLMSMAVEELYPGVGLGVGPAIDDGFYQDYDLPEAVTPEILPKLEEKIRQLIKQDIKFEQYDMDFADAHEFYKNDPYKTWFIDDLKAKGESKVSFYRSGDFDNLCAGPHVSSAGEINPDAFQLTKVAGAYWRGDEKNKMLQRIYGVAFSTKEELDKYLEDVEQAKLRDHRRLGQELDLFTFSDLVGAGLPMYTPRGTILIDQLKGMLREISKKYDMLPVSIPHLAKIELYETSGHASKFSDELFRVKSHYDQEFILKPVNCPHHTQIYASSPRSYRDLPLRYIEQTMQYRDEKPGAIGGLQRTRGFTVDDGHTFCRPDQIEQEASLIAEVVKGFYENLGLWGNHWVSLSVSDPKTPDKYIGEPADWEMAEKMLSDVAEKYNLDAKRMEGEAAIYGPKIDFMFQDALGRETQLATIQLDFAMPKRFGLKYTDQDGKEVPPVMIHRAILGSFERFIMLLIEHYGGWFPFWLAPEQVRILTINDTVSDYVGEVKSVLSNTTLMKPIKYGDIRFTVDDRNESLGKKIREATNWKIPVQLIVGPKDVEAREVSVRTQKGEEKVQLDQLSDYLMNL